LAKTASCALEEEDANLSLQVQVEKCETFLKEKDKRLKTLVGELKNVEKLLNETTKAKSETDRTIRVLDGKIKFAFINKNL